MSEDEWLAVGILLVTGIIFGSLCWINFGPVLCRRPTDTDYEDLDKEVVPCPV